MSAFRVIGVIVLTMAVVGVAAAQLFTGGLLGAVRDANGVALA